MCQLGVLPTSAGALTCHPDGSAVVNRHPVSTGQQSNPPCLKTGKTCLGSDLVLQSPQVLVDSRTSCPFGEKLRGGARALPP